jgi:hypothetical protein
LFRELPFFLIIKKQNITERWLEGGGGLERGGGGKEGSTVAIIIGGTKFFACRYAEDLTFGIQSVIAWKSCGHQ